MSRFRCMLLFLLFALLMLDPPPAVSAPFGLLNRITGQVYDDAHQPVIGIDVELLSEVDSLLARTRTNGSGSFSFVGVSRGRFQIRVLPLSHGLLGETKDVEVTPLYSEGSDSVYVDFYLKRERRGTPAVPTGPGEVIFAQEVPNEAKRLFDLGVRELERGQISGLTSIKAAVAAFPDYYDALGLLGREYVRLGKYSEGYPYLLRAVDIHQRSAANYYSLAYAFYNLNQTEAALKAIQGSLALDASSAITNLLYGTLLRVKKDHREAESVLLKALKLYGGSDAETHWQLALLYNRTHRNAEAVQQLELYLKLIKDVAEKKKVADLIAKLKSSKPATAPEKH